MSKVEFLDWVLGAGKIINVKLDIRIFLLWEVRRYVNMHNNLVELWDACKPPAGRR
jgi:hypothetical protein